MRFFLKESHLKHRSFRRRERFDSAQDTVNQFLDLHPAQDIFGITGQFVFRTVIVFQLADEGPSSRIVSLAMMPLPIGRNRLPNRNLEKAEIMPGGIVFFTDWPFG